MSGRHKPTDEIKTSIRDANLATPVTKVERPMGFDDRATLHEIEVATPTTVDPRRPRPPAAEPPRGKRKTAKSEPLRVISMKTPAEIAAARSEAATAESRKQLHVQLRSMAEVSGQHTRPNAMGNLAPPRDAREVRGRRVRDNLIWACLAFIVACLVTIAVWFLARR